MSHSSTILSLLFGLTLLASTLTLTFFSDLSLTNQLLIAGTPLLLLLNSFMFKKRVLSVSLLPIFLTLFTFSISAGIARSEFWHFDTPPSVFHPIGIFILLGIFIIATLFSLRRTPGSIKACLVIVVLGTTFSFALLLDGLFLVKKGHCGTPELTPPDSVVRYLLTAEDPRFYLHGGVDIHRLRMAVRERVLSGSFGRGGSTVTMQYAKVCFLTREKTLLRKIRQTAAALIVDATTPKQEILSRYLSSIPFGDGTIGIAEASEHYFNKKLMEISVSEALDLILTIYDPTSYNPHKRPTSEISARRAVIRIRAKKLIL